MMERRNTAVNKENTKLFQRIIRSVIILLGTHYSLRHFDKGDPGILDVAVICLLPVYVVFETARIFTTIRDKIRGTDQNPV